MKLGPFLYLKVINVFPEYIFVTGALKTNECCGASQKSGTLNRVQKTVKTVYPVHGFPVYSEGSSLAEFKAGKERPTMVHIYK